MKRVVTLKSLFSQGRFDEEFIEAAKRELPALWGRESLLEEFYGINAPGMGDRSHNLHAQLGTPQRYHGGPLWKLWKAFTG